MHTWISYVIPFNYVVRVDGIIYTYVYLFAYYFMLDDVNM